MNTKVRQALATKYKILETAKKLIEKYGYENVSVDQIVAGCGIAKGTFYHHFKTKDAIITEICGTLYDNLRQEANKLQNISNLERLRHYITTWHREASTYNLHIARQMIKLYSAPSDLGEYGGKISQMELGIQVLEEYLEDAVSAGELSAETPVETIAKALMFSMQGSTIYHCKCGEDFNVLAWNKQFMEHVLDPLLAPYDLSSK